jgi:hypothetical protein
MPNKLNCWLAHKIAIIGAGAALGVLRNGRDRGRRIEAERPARGKNFE